MSERSTSVAAAAEHERTLGQLVSEASADLSILVRHELALAKAEMRQDVKNGAVGAGMFGAAGYLGMVASILIFIGAALALALVLPGWAAFLIVAGALLLLAGLLALVGKSRVSKVGPPERTIRTTKETIAAVKPGSHPA